MGLVAIDTHVLHMVESSFLAQLCVATFVINFCHWNDSFHGCIIGRRRDGAMHRAVSVRFKKDGIQHMTDFEDMSNAFACTSVNCRAEVLEELVNETDISMFFEMVLNSTARHGSDEGHFFPSPQCGNLMGSSEGPIFFLAACALRIIRWNLRTTAWEEELLPLLQGSDTVRPGVRSGTRLSLMTLEHSDRIVDEELEERGWKRNMDKREVMPSMRGKRPCFVLAGKKGHFGGSSPLGWTLHVEWQQSGGAALPKESDTHCVAFNGQILDGEGTLGQRNVTSLAARCSELRCWRRRRLRGTTRRCRRSSQCFASFEAVRKRWRMDE